MLACFGAVFGYRIFATAKVARTIKIKTQYQVFITGSLTSLESRFWVILTLLKFLNSLVWSLLKAKRLARNPFLNEDTKKLDIEEVYGDDVSSSCLICHK